MGKCYLSLVAIYGVWLYAFADGPLESLTVSRQEIR